MDEEDEEAQNIKQVTYVTGQPDTYYARWPR
jgi:hypothetical protein